MGNARGETLDSQNIDVQCRAQTSDSHLGGTFQDLAVAWAILERLHGRINLLLRRRLQQLEQLKLKGETTTYILEENGHCKAMMSLAESRGYKTNFLAIDVVNDVLGAIKRFKLNRAEDNFNINLTLKISEGFSLDCLLAALEAVRICLNTINQRRKKETSAYAAIPRNNSNSKEEWRMV